MPLWTAAVAEIAVELYDHEGDDGKNFGGDEEANNLAADPSYSADVASLTKQLEAAYGSGKPDPTPIKPTPAPAPGGNCSAACAQKAGCDCHCFCQVCHGKCVNGCYDKCLGKGGCSQQCM